MKVFNDDDMREDIKKKILSFLIIVFLLSCCEVRLLFHIDLTSDIILKRMNKLFIKRAKKIVCKNISQSHSAQKFCVWEKLFLFQFYVEKMVK
jgi:hypothetical protein